MQLQMPALLRASPSRPLKTEPAWDDFPEGCDTTLTSIWLTCQTPSQPRGKRIQPCSPGTIRTRRAELVAMARMAVRLGVPIESLTSLAALLQPDVVELVIDAYWQKNGEKPKRATIDLGWKAAAHGSRDRLPGPSRA